MNPCVEQVLHEKKYVVLIVLAFHGLMLRCLEVYCIICVCATITCVVKSSLMFTVIIQHAPVIAETVMCALIKTKGSVKMCHIMLS